MSDHTVEHSDVRRRTFRRLFPVLLLITTLTLSLSCSVSAPFGVKPTPTSGLAPVLPTATPGEPPTPTPLPQPLPAALVESDPPQSAEVALNGPITLYFNQPMDHASVEAALTSQMQQELTFNWVDDSTVIVYLNQPLPPDSDLALNLGTEARSAQGKPLMQPINLNYRTAGYLQLAQSLPAKDTVDVDPTSAIVASFNRPVVALGSDPASAPAAFTLEPSAEGSGEWLNTSTYIFYPKPSLVAGQAYTVRIDPGLKSTDGGPLKEAPTWSFTTAMPRLVSVEPTTETPWALDAAVKLTFNQPMDPASVQANFSLVSADGGLVQGQTSWDKENTVFTFKPGDLLRRGTTYFVKLSGTAQAYGGTPLGEALEASIVTVPSLAVANTEPAAGKPMDPTYNFMLYLNAPIQEKNLLQKITIEPSVPNLNYYYDPVALSISLFGAFAPSTAYTLRISPDLTDIWGGNMGQEAVIQFNTTQLRPRVDVLATSSVVFLDASEPTLLVQAANVSTVPTSVGSIPLLDFFSLLGPNSWQYEGLYQGFQRRSWSQTLSLLPDQVQTTPINLSPDGNPLAPGVYFLSFDYPQPLEGSSGPNPSRTLIVASHLQVTFKVSPSDALVWVVDMRSGAPLPGAPVTVYADDGTALAQGLTDGQGIFHGPLSQAIKEPYSMKYAVVGQPGDDLFGMSLSYWNAGIDPYDFGIQSRIEAPGLHVYFYSDRPIYRPGQTVYFRAVVRKAYNGRYTPPDIASLPVTIYGNEGQELAKLDLPISAFGTAHGEYNLPASIQPGYFSINTSVDQNAYLSFQVANYRKPEINLQVGFSGDQILAGQTLKARLEARYFFDAPASNAQVHWTLYAARSSFSLPGYQVGPEDTSWLEAFRIPSFGPSLGNIVDEGDGKIGQDGTLELEFPTQVADTRMTYTLEATTQDESGLPVSGRGSVQVNPDEFYIGVQPDSWTGSAGEESGFEIQVVEWQKMPSGERSLRADFQKVKWIRQDPPPTAPYEGPSFTAQYSPIGSTDFVTNQDGMARLAFTPPEPGTYMLDVYNAQTGQGKGARTQVILWVSGAGEVAWPNIPNSRLRLVTDKESYNPGDTAQIFIPNPFNTDALALVATERGVIMQHQLLTISAGGYNLSLPLTADDAPNVYLSVTLLGHNAQGALDFRQGLVNISVEAREQILKVTLLGQPQRAAPGETVTFEIQVTDFASRPVQGEFSLAVVDLAALALADPNSQDIVTAAYGKQPDGVQTSLSLAASNRRQIYLAGGMGGGGGGEALSVTREKFPDTAYWNAEVVTGPDGKAEVTITLPDTLTTWKVDSRGITQDSLVGQAETLLVTTKDLLVRPVTPRFFVMNDHIQLAAIVQNNTSRDLQAEVSLQAKGLALDDPTQNVQQVSVPANGRTRVEWWGVALDTPSVDLTFAAQSGSLQDSVRPASGALPVLRYVAPQAFRTSGIMDSSGEITELVSLPRSFKAQDGQLDLELAPSPMAAMLKSLDALESSPYQSTEQILSSFLPGLELYQTLQQYGLEDPALKSRLDRTLNQGLQALQASQRPDGGWAWWPGGESDPYVTTYVLFGLIRSRGVGITISQEMTQRAIEYLKAATGGSPQGNFLSRLLFAPLRSLLPGGGGPAQPYEWDRLAFQEYVLTLAGAGDAGTSQKILEERDQLSPWAQALLALTLESQSPASVDAVTLLSDLQTSAIRSSTGAYWEMRQDEAGRKAAGMNMHTDLSNSAVVLFALAQRDPAAPLVADGMRYLMANRSADGAWFSTYTSAWTLIALNEVVKGTGELGGSFSFEAVLNQSIIAQGQAAGSQQLTSANAEVPAQRMYPDYPNALVIRRGDGTGRLYYAASLTVSRPVEDVSPLSEGLSIARAVYPFGDACPNGDCPAINAARAGEKVTVRLSLTLPHDAYYLAVSDYIPAGAEILDVGLKTTQVGEGGEASTQITYDPRRPLEGGWGWERFSQPQIYDDHILWTGASVPAGSYELTYTLVLLQPGQFRVVPARAWQLYFPEVQANSAGSVFEIKP